MSYVPNSSTTTVYKRTHIERYKTHKEIIYSQPGYSSDVSTRYIVVLYIKIKLLLTERVKIIFYINRYLSWSNSPLNFIGKYNAADSDTELEETLTSSSIKTNQRWKIVQWVTYLTTFITIWFKKTVEFFKFKTNRRQYYDAQAYRSYNGITGT